MRESTKLTEEVSTAQAAEITAVGPSTVVEYYFAGLLPARNLARRNEDYLNRPIEADDRQAVPNEQ